MKRIAILSSIGPPWGGVGVHINRLLYRLRDRNIPYVMYDQLGKNIPSRNIVAAKKSITGLIRFIFGVKEDIIHLHTSNPYVLIFLIILLRVRKKNIISTFHNQNVVDKFNFKSRIIRSMIVKVLLNIDHSICVNKNVYSFMLSLDISPLNMSLIPAFLPPSEAEMAESNLSKDILSFIESHQIIVGSHGWFGHFINNIHVYSFDMIMKLIDKVTAIFPDVGFYTVVTDTYNYNHRKSILKYRKLNGLEKHWLIIEDPNLNAAALYRKSDLFIRPTITDGDSVSIRECLYLGIPVIASDCVPRPKGCVTFKSRDQGAFEETVLKLLNDLPSAKKMVAECHVEDTTEKIMNIYSKLINQ